jgi:glycosyltransferase involved in cell wall biosynthesis
MVFIPAYRCEKQIGRVLAQFTPAIAQRFAEIVVVENRSPDGTLEAARLGLAAIEGCPVTLLQNDENYSLGGSHKVAFNYCLAKGYDYLVVLHGDDQGRISDILPYLEDGNFERYDCLLGARFMPGSQLNGYSILRIIGNYVFNAVATCLTGRLIYDLGSGLNLYKATALAGNYYLNFPNFLLFNEYMLLYFTDQKKSLKFFPISWREEDQASNAKLFSIARSLFSIFFNYAFRRRRLLHTSHCPENNWPYHVAFSNTNRPEGANK